MSELFSGNGRGYLEKSADLFFCWKRTVDKAFDGNNFNRGDIVVRYCGREYARLLENAPSDLRKECVSTYRWQNSPAVRVEELLNCETDGAIKEAIFCAIEMFRIAFCEDVYQTHCKKLPPSKAPLVEFARREMLGLMNNDYYQALYGVTPLLYSVSRVRALFSPLLEIPRAIPRTPNDAQQKYRRRLTGGRKIPILTRRVDSLTTTPPTQPIPDTSDGVGSMTQKSDEREQSCSVELETRRTDSLKRRSRMR